MSRILKTPNDSSQNPNRYKTRQGAFPEFEKALFDWILIQFSQRKAINGRMIIENGARIMEKMNMALPCEQQINLSLSNGWLYNFQQRHGLRSFKSYGESGDADDQAIAENMERLKAKILSYNPEDCYNADEFGLFYRMAPDRTIAVERMPGRKKEKVRMTFLACANADGTDRIPLLIIGKSRRPHCFKKKTGQELGFDYHWNSKAWMTGQIFVQWMSRFSTHIRSISPSKKVLLLLDNASVHVSVEVLPSLDNVEVLFLPPNTTSKIQPMDAGVIASLKKRYRKYLYQRSLDQMDIELKDIYKIDQLTAMKKLKVIWENDIPNKVFWNCWIHTGLLSGARIEGGLQDEERSVPEELMSFVRQLVPERVFQRITVDSLLNVEGENDECTRTPTVEEIALSAVEDIHNDEEDCVDEDQDTTLLEELTVEDRLGYLAVVLLILEEEGEGNSHAIPVLRRTQRLLRGRRISNMTQSRITSFFGAQ